MLLSSVPAAAERPRVQLAIDACLVARDEIERVVMIELGDLVAPAPDKLDERTHATARCEDGAVVLHVDDPVTHRSVWRRIALPAEPRLIALALVELISASWTELEPPRPAPAPAPAPTPAVAVPRAPVAAPSIAEPSITAPPPSLAVAIDPPHYRAILTAGALRFSEDAQTLAGVGVRIADSSRRSLGWMIDGQAHRGTQAMSLGELSTGVLALGAAAQLHLFAGRTRFDLGAGLRGGAVHMSGMANAMSVQGSSFWSRWWGPLVLGNAAVSITERIAIDAAAETGYVLSPVSALVGGQRAAAVDGTWLELHLGIVVLL